MHLISKANKISKSFYYISLGLAIRNVNEEFFKKIFS